MAFLFVEEKNSLLLLGSNIKKNWKIENFDEVKKKFTETTKYVTQIKKSKTRYPNIGLNFVLQMDYSFL